MIAVKVRSQGNSVGVTFPAETRIRLGLEVGQELTLIELADGLKLVKRNLKLERQLELAREVLRDQADVLQETRQTLDPEFLEPDAVLFLHDQALREYGGIQGVESEDLLHSALGRPVNQHAYVGGDLPSLAAAYAYGLARKPRLHRRNGVALDLAAADAIDRMLELAAGQSDEGEFAAWLRSGARG